MSNKSVKKAVEAVKVEADKEVKQVVEVAKKVEPVVEEVKPKELVVAKIIQKRPSTYRLLLETGEIVTVHKSKFDKVKKTVII